MKALAVMRLLFLLGTWHAASLDVFAAPFFSLPFKAPVAGSPSSIGAADVNLDGKVDIVVVFRDVASVSLLTNGGDGTFAMAATIALPATAHKVIADDVNGDGRPDLIVAHGTAVPAFSVLTNAGPNVFVPASTGNAISTSANGFMTTDLDKDGWSELVVANGGYLAVYTNDHAGQFTLSVSLYSGFYPYTVVAADFNGDGWVDLIGGNYESVPTLVTNNGHGGMVNAGSLPWIERPDSMKTTDFNHDGQIDWVLNNIVLTNNGFGVVSVANTNVAGKGDTLLAFADLDGDTWIDVIAATDAGVRLKVRTNNGAGVLTTSVKLDTGALPVAVLTVDVDGDGRLDIVSANSGENKIAIVLNSASLALPWVRSGTDIVISWPITQPPMYLEAATNCPALPAEWIPVYATTNGPVTRMEATVAPSLPLRVFRLHD